MIADTHPKGIRRMKKTAPAVYLLLLTAPLFAACSLNPRVPMDPNTTITPLSVSAPPIYALLGFRRELDLTSDQIAALDELAQKVQAENADLLKGLQANSRERQRQPGYYDLLPQGIALLEEVRENYREAAEAVLAVLDDEQERTVCRLFRPDRVGRFASGGGAAAEVDPLRNPAAWEWCADRAPATSEAVAARTDD
jgi:hypothetical protein